MEKDICKEDDEAKKEYIGKLIQSIPAKAKSMWEDINAHPKFATVATYSKGDTILEQGILYSVVVVILRGSCRLERRLGDDEVSFFNLEVLGHDIHGSSGFLFKSHSPTSLVANENGVQVLLIKFQLLSQILLETCPTNVICFYYQLCRCLCERYSQQLDSLF